MISNFKKLIKIAFNYHSLFYIFVVLSVLLFFGFSAYYYLFTFFFTIFFAFYTSKTHKKNLEYIDRIKILVQDISSNKITEAKQIQLPAEFSELEKEIQNMFIKNQDAIAYLQKLEKMRSEFLANVSHELRTPIFTIQGYLETLLNGAMQDEKVNSYFLEKANHHTVNLSNLLNDLIDISMIETGEMRMSFRYFRVCDFLSPIINDFLPITQSKGLLLELKCEKKNLQLFGDKAKLKQVLSNLIQNSLKYTESGFIRVEVLEEEKFGLIKVIDSGIGIPEYDIERIFERFYRVDKARSREVGGTGLGLAIVKHIIEAHGSKVEVKSEVNKGSEFSFRLKK